MSIKYEAITPAVAEALLARNTNNRRLSPITVGYYKSQMLQGKWRENGETLKIADDGQLLDGQHRLAAIKECGLTIKMAVARDVDPDTAVTIDTGRNRGPADHLAVWGIKTDVNILAAAAVIAKRFDKSGKYNRSHYKIPPWEIIEFVEKHRGLQESLGRIPQSVGKICPRAICVAMHYIFSTYIDPTKAEIFFDRFNSGAQLKRGSPILALRNRLMEMKASRQSLSNSYNRVMVIYYFVQAFKAWMEDREMKSMLYKPGSTPDLEETL